MRLLLLLPFAVLSLSRRALLVVLLLGGFDKGYQVSHQAVLHRPRRQQPLHCGLRRGLVHPLAPNFGPLVAAAQNETAKAIRVPHGSTAAAFVFVVIIAIAFVFAAAAATATTPWPQVT
jgi:hypothetical protein